jgi:hypothetical protein
MTGIWFLKKNDVIIPYNECQNSYEGIDIIPRVYDLMGECNSGDKLEIFCELPE